MYVNPDERRDKNGVWLAFAFCISFGDCARVRRLERTIGHRLWVTGYGLRVLVRARREEMGTSVGVGVAWK